MPQSVKLADDIMAPVRNEAELKSRSLAGQIAHWIKIGRAVERSGVYDEARMRDVLAGKYDTTHLTEEEDAVWLDEFTQKMGTADDAECKFYEQRRRLGLGVGLDQGGNLIYATDDGPE